MLALSRYRHVSPIRAGAMYYIYRSDSAIARPSRINTSMNNQICPGQAWIYYDINTNIKFY